MKKKSNIAYDIICVLMLVILLMSLYTAALQKNYGDSTVESDVEKNTKCSDAIHKLISDKLTREDFNIISDEEDMDLPRYKELQQQLNELRSLNSTRYLYTAKRGADGRLIYLIDGLELGAEDFAYPGTYIEEEMISYIEDALNGKRVYSQEIVDTTWGHIFTACYPVIASDGSGDVIGALCIEMDMEDTYDFIADCKRKTIHIAALAAVVLLGLGFVVYLAVRKRRRIEAKQQLELEEAVENADAANKAKSTFLFNMSHDIRTPMNAILGFSDIAMGNLEDEEKTRDYLRKINLCGKKMLAILDNVLELSRIESGKVTLEEKPAVVEDIFDGCLVMVQSELEKKKLKLEITKNIIEPYLYMDTTCITEVILNLVSNSIKYTGAGGIIQCGISQKETDEEDVVMLILSVSDNGIGMSEEFQKHIYELFSRERSSTTSGVDGSGLGMGIVKKFVDLMKGTIDLTSKVDVGTTFVISIPCKVAASEDLQPVMPVSDEDGPALYGRRILLAEDNDLNAEIAIQQFKSSGAVIERADDGVKCLEMLKEKPDDYYSIILMDIQMPVLDGYETTKKIRKLDNKVKANIPIVAMTANAFAEDRRKALEVGMNDHIAKPIDMKKLIPTLLKYI